MYLVPRVLFPQRQNYSTPIVMRFYGFLQAFLLVSLVSSASYEPPLECSSGIMPTPSYGTEDAVFTVCGNVTINSTPPKIYEVLLDFLRYPAWNTFTYQVDLPANVTSVKDVYVGMIMELHTDGLITGVNTTSTEKVSYLEPHADPPFAGWGDDSGSIGNLVLEAEHISLLRKLPDGTTQHLSWETYYGPGAVAVLVLKDNLQTEFQQQAEDLKKRVESLEQ